MGLHDFNAQRLYLDEPLENGRRIVLAREQANYLINVLRMSDGDELLVFNGRDGEWRARIVREGKRDCVLHLADQTRTQTAPSELVYLFAPLKRARLDYMVQKAVEMGAGRLVPVLTRRTVAERLNLDRMRANAIEAAEQCGILNLPRIDAPRPLAQVLADWPERQPLVFCDEAAPAGGPVPVLERLGDGPIGVLIGPEGGFDPQEREALLARPFVTAISLGPRIMRADTAAVAALALVNAVKGDWR